MTNSPLDHSPAPWTYDDNRAGHEGMVNVFDANDKIVICTGDMEDCTWTDMCDASLIAAAPELLKACEAVTKEWDAAMGPTEAAWKIAVILPQLRAAIAKAYAVTITPESD
jgi:hypothetical protein